MSPGTKKALLFGGLIGAGLFVAGLANAADADGGGEEPGDCPEGFVPLFNPQTGQWSCVRAPENGGDDTPPPPPDDGGIDDPLPPKPAKCNYSGCGAQFDGSHSHPGVYAQAISQLGYPINFVAIGQNGSLIAVAPARNLVREFQRDYNAVRASPPAPAVSPLAFAPIAAGPKLAEDGFVGDQTIAAIGRAKTAVNNSGMTWLAAVELSA
jgi:hypothetical protein